MTVQSYRVENTFLTAVASHGLSGGVTLYNPSTSATIRVSDSASGVGFPLSPGTTITWDANRAIYAAADAVAELVILDNDGTINTPQILASLTAQSLVSSGLASSIASQISITGAPALDAQSTVYSTTFTSATADWYSPSIDVRQYQSVSVRVIEVESAFLATPIARGAKLLWRDSTSAIPNRDVDAFAFTGTNSINYDQNGWATYQVSTRAPELMVKLEMNAASGTAITVEVIGSHKNVSSPRYIMRSNYAFNQSPNYGLVNFDVASDGSMWGIHANAKTAGTYITYPPVMGGQPVSYFVAADSVTVAGQMLIRDALQPEIFYSRTLLPVAGGQQQFTGTFMMPNRPISAWIIGTGGNFRFSLSSQTN